MDAELQTNEELGTDEIGEELATSEDESQEETVKAPEGFIRAEDAQKDINKQHRKYRDEERARKKVEAEADRLKRELEEIKAKSIDLSVPPIPDPYDADYEQKIQARDEAIQRKTTHDARRASIEAEQKRAEQQKADQEEEKLREKVIGFDSNMVKLGLNPIEVKQAADTLVDYGISDTLQDVLLEDSEGPLFVAYLANNPMELDTIGGMSALQMVNYLNQTVRPKASLLRKQTSKAPNPPLTLKGGGVSEQEDPLLKGARFE